MKKKVSVLIVSVLLLSAFARAEGPVVSALDDGAFLLGAEQAQVLKKGVTGAASAARLIPLPDGDGFTATQVIAPVPPEEGVMAWTIDVPKAGRYLVTLEYSHGRHGNAFELHVGEQTLNGFVPDTRGCIGLIEVGEISLTAGRQNVLLQNTSAEEKTFMIVSSIYMRPVLQREMTRPQIRAAIMRHTPRKLPIELLVPSVFSDHMVLQRRMPVPVWGRDAVGREITVRFRDQIKQVRTDAEGRWLTQLDSTEAGGPFELEISDGTKSVCFTDVLVGEVWFGSGQSNMQISVKSPPQSAKPGQLFECDEETKELLEKGCAPQIRISAIMRDHSNIPFWFALTRENCLDAPALMSCVAVLLRKKLDVPIGIVVRSESSSSAGIWLSRDAVEGDPEIQRQIGEYAAKEYPKLVAEYPDKEKAWEADMAKAKATGAKEPSKPALPILPGRFPSSYSVEGHQFEPYGVNFTARIAPVIPYAIRGIVWDQGENGTGIAGADQSTVMPALVREWRTRWGQGNLPFIYVDKKCLTAEHRDAMAKLPATARADYQGLSTVTHPPDKASYARRIVEQMAAFQ